MLLWNKQTAKCTVYMGIMEMYHDVFKSMSCAQAMYAGSLYCSAHVLMSFFIALLFLSCIFCGGACIDWHASVQKGHPCHAKDTA